MRQKLHYFGSWSVPEGAVKKYIDQRDDLYAGRTPRARGEGLTVQDLVNRFFRAKIPKRDCGELSPRMFEEYHAACAGITAALGVARLVSDHFVELTRS